MERVVAEPQSSDERWLGREAQPQHDDGGRVSADRHRHPVVRSGATKADGAANEGPRSRASASHGHRRDAEVAAYARGTRGKSDRAPGRGPTPGLMSQNRLRTRVAVKVRPGHASRLQHAAWPGSETVFRHDSGGLGWTWVEFIKPNQSRSTQINCLCPVAELMTAGEILALDQLDR